jgi:hypothetical protein
MSGDDRVRFCSECRRSVYNLSGMTREAAEALVLGSEGRVCVRYYRRPDGTMMTTDCLVARRRMWRRWLAVGVSAATVIVLAILGRPADRDSHGHALRDTLGTAQDVEPIRTVVDWIDPPQGFTMGTPLPPPPPPPGQNPATNP